MNSPAWLERAEPSAGWAGRADGTARATLDRSGSSCGGTPSTVSTRCVRPSSRKTNLRPWLIHEDFTSECDPQEARRCQPAKKAMLPTGNHRPCQGLNCVPQFLCPPVFHNVTVFEETVFKEGWSENEAVRLSPKPSLLVGVLLRRGNLYTHTTKTT